MLRFFSYRLPFKKPYRAAGTLFTHREGIILVYEDAEHQVEAYGEIAPLPGYSKDKPEQIKQVLTTNKKPISEALQNGTAAQLFPVIEQIHGFPSLSFGLDTLAHDLEAKRKGIPLAALLNTDFSITVESNALLPLQDEQSTLNAAEDFIKQGFNTLKVKVGIDFDQELSVLKKLRDAYPDISLRADANQSWQPKQAAENLRKLSELDLEYVEQPIRAGSLEAMIKLHSKSSVPIAADEDAHTPKQALEIAKHTAADALILKPSFLGSYKNFNVIRNAADTNHISAVVTTALESGVGRAAVAALAASIKSPNRFAHGLSTGLLFTKDLIKENWLDEPLIHIPDTPGLGISLHSDVLKEW